MFADALAPRRDCSRGFSFSGVLAVRLFSICLAEKGSLLGFSDRQIEKRVSVTHKHQKKGFLWFLFKSDTEFCK